MKPIRYIKFNPTPEQRSMKILELLSYFCAGVAAGVVLFSMFGGCAYGQTPCNPAVSEKCSKIFETPFVRAIIASESSFNPKAVSKAGAVGLMQLKPSTAYYVHKALFGGPLPPDRLEDPYVNVALGTTYLLEMIYKFRDIDLALAAYNGGPGAVKRGFRAKAYVHKIHKQALPKP